MGSALSGVMGGDGGGGLLGAVGGAIGGIFGGPIGAMVGQAVGNMLQDAIGDATKDGLRQLQQEHGMPNFLADLVQGKVDGTLSQLRNNDVPAEAQDAAQGHFGEAMAEFKTDFQQDFVNGVVRARNEGCEESGGGKGAGGWLQAIAKAMGDTLGAKAGHMVELSSKMSQLQKESKSGNEAQDKQNASEFNKTMTEFQATGQEYSMLNNVFSTAIKALGEALSSMARKQ